MRMGSAFEAAKAPPAARTRNSHAIVDLKIDLFMLFSFWFVSLRK
jgi:hypothetical protein